MGINITLGTNIEKAWNGLLLLVVLLERTLLGMLLPLYSFNRLRRTPSLLGLTPIEHVEALNPCESSLVWKMIRIKFKYLLLHVGRRL